MGENAYYTLEQATKILQVSEATIRRGIKKGLIPRAKFCGKVLIPAWFIKEGFEKEQPINY
ncbi:excisionase family DNA binding protein [Anaerotaenia torta]|uniref:helix-turn-helix domain-containing protein n=1 Tax=Anaerotaenia torta TaxID=433293 RepID=UPI003D254586